MSINQPNNTLEAIQADTVRSTSVFETPVQQSGLWNRIRAPFRMVQLGAEGFAGEYAANLYEKTTGASTKKYTGQELMDQMPYLKFDPDAEYDLTPSRLRVLQHRNNREFEIGLEQQTLTPATGLSALPLNLLQTVSGLAGGLYGSTFGDPVGFGAGVAIGAATEGLLTIPAVGAVGGRVLSILPRTVQTGVRAGLAGTGRTGAFYRQFRLGLIENTFALPLYKNAMESEGVEYTATDAVLDIGVNSAFQGLGGALFPKWSRNNETIPLVPKIKEVLDVDKTNLDAVVSPPSGFDGEQLQLGLGENLNIQRQLQLDLESVTPERTPAATGETQLQFDLESITSNETQLQFDFDTEVPSTPEPISFASPEMNNYLTSNTVGGDIEGLVNMVNALEEDMIDVAILGEGKADPNVAMAQLISSGEAKAIRSAIKEVFPELANELNLFDRAQKVLTTAGKEARDLIRRGYASGDIDTLRNSFEAALKKVKNSLKNTTPFKKSEVRNAELQSYIDAEKAAKEKAISEGYGQPNRKSEGYKGALKKNDAYTKAYNNLRKAEERLGTSVLKEADPEREGLKALKEIIEKRLAAMGDGADPLQMQPVSMFGDQLDALNVPRELEGLLSASTLKKELYGKDGVRKLNNLKKAIAKSIQKNISDMERFLDMQEATRKELFGDNPPPDVLKEQQSLMDLAKKYKDPETLLTGQTDTINQKIEILKSMEGDLPKFATETMQENLDRARTLAEKHAEMDQNLVKHLLCVLGG